MTKLLLAVMVSVGSLAFAGDKYLHINVGDPHEKVRVSVPLAWVEKLLPTVHVRYSRHKHDGISPRELLDAVRRAPDGEFVTVEGRDDEIRVAKSGGYLLVKARDGRRWRSENVEIKLPLKVLEALANDTDHLDLGAAIRAISEHCDALISVEGDREKVRIWVDEKRRQ